MNKLTITCGIVFALVAAISAYGVGESYGSRYESFDGIEDGGHYGGGGYETEENHDDGGYEAASYGGHEAESYGGLDDGHHGGGGHGGHGGHGGGGGHDGHDYKDYKHHPSYRFEYGVKDPKTKDSHSHWEHRDGDKVHGEYSLDEADGTKRVVKYTADKHNGFQAHVQRIGHAKHDHGHHHHNNDYKVHE